jgi:hypothetical protein
MIRARKNAHKGEKEKYTEFKNEGKRPLVGINVVIILKQILNKCGVWTGIIWLETGSSVKGGEHNTEPSGFMKGRIFLDQLSNYQLLNKTLFHGSLYVTNHWTPNLRVTQE